MVGLDIGQVVEIEVLKWEPRNPVGVANETSFSANFHALVDGNQFVLQLCRDLFCRELAVAGATKIKNHICSPFRFPYFIFCCGSIPLTICCRYSFARALEHAF